MLGGPMELQAELTLNTAPMGRTDAQSQPAVGDDVGGERLHRERGRVAGKSGNYGSSHLNAAGQLPGQGNNTEHVVFVRGLRKPEAVEAVPLCVDDLLDLACHRGRRACRAYEQSNAH